MCESVDLVFRQGSTELSHLARAEPHLYLRPERPVVLTALRYESVREREKPPALPCSDRRT